MEGEDGGNKGKGEAEKVRRKGEVKDVRKRIKPPETTCRQCASNMVIHS